MHDLNTRELSGLGAIVNGYDGFIIDLFGTIHDGVALFPEAIKTCRHILDLNKKLLFLSNAPRCGHAVFDKLISMGMDANLLDNILTSGDLARDFLGRYDGESYFFLGVASKDQSLIEDIAMQEVKSMQDADIIVCSNYLDARPDTSDYEEDFKAAILNDVPMLCANPDRIVYIGDRLCYCAGELADFYQKLGGLVIQLGKPYPAVYQHISDLFPCQKMLAIGDAMGTDILGANQTGIDSVLVGTGIHQKYLSVTPLQWIQSQHQDPPQYYLPRLCL